MTPLITHTAYPFFFCTNQLYFTYFCYNIHSATAPLAPEFTNAFNHSVLAMHSKMSFHNNKINNWSNIIFRTLTQIWQTNYVYNNVAHT